MFCRTLIVLLCLVLATEAMVKVTHSGKQSVKNHIRNRKVRTHGVACDAGGVCYDKDGGADKCVDSNGYDVPNIQPCNAPGSVGFAETGTVYCCPGGYKLKSTMESGLEDLVGMIDSIHHGHVPSGNDVKSRIVCSASIFTTTGDATELVAEPVLSVMSQYDMPSGSTLTPNQNRCGPTAAVAAAVNKGTDSLLALIEWAKKAENCPSPQTTLLTPMTASVGAKTTTFGELAQLIQILYDCFTDHNADGAEPAGISGAQMVQLLKGAGIAVFNRAAKGSITGVKPEARFPKGESWGLLLDERHHWILVGQSRAPDAEPGKPFVYDPDSYEDLDHIYYYDPAKTAEENKLFLDYFGTAAHPVSSGWPQ